MEGVERYKVRLLPNNPAWRAEFDRVRAVLEACWPQNILAIEHVGSTAVPSIEAKPILDVAVRLRSVAAMDTAALERQGYDCCGPQHGNEKYHLFVLRGADGASLHHIHCYDRSEPEFFQLVGFRDYLNAHSEAAAQYAALKRTLAARYPDDRQAYTAGKAAFIRSVYGRLP